MEYRQAIVTPAAAQRDLMRLLPQLRDCVDNAVIRLRTVGDDPLAFEGTRAAVLRLYSGFRFVAVAELERLAEELDASVNWLRGSWADPFADQQGCWALQGELLSVLLSCNELIEEVAAGSDPIAGIAAAIDSLRCARAAPRYDSLALLRQCVDARAPRGWIDDPSERTGRARWPYQIGLLELLRGDEQRGLRALRSVLEPLESGLGDSAAGSACWLVLGLVEALDGGAEPEVADKRALAAYDRELRRLAEGGDCLSQPPTSMLEALLSRVAAIPAHSGRAAQLKQLLGRIPAAELALPGAAAADEAGHLLLAAVQPPEVEPDEELQALFYAEVEPALAQLGVALKRWRYGDGWAGLAIQRILHNLRQSSRLYSLQGFAEHCREIEHEVAAALADGLDHLAAERLRGGLESLAEELEQLRRALRSFPRLPAAAVETESEGRQAESPGAVEESGARLVQPQLWGFLEPLFDRLLTAIEQAAAERGRSLDLEVVAVDGHLAAQAVERIGEALEPLVVNAVIHGIEPLQRRQQQGKPGRGTLRLRAWQESSDVLITVSDNGGGLDLPGLQSQLSDYDPLEPAGELSNDETLSLIALPGVSLVTEPNAPSRPGEGMGQATRTAREMGGVLELETVPGSGVTFTLRLPADLLETQPPDEVDESSEAARQRVLIVNDSRTLRRITAYLLGYMRFTMLEANSLAEAVMLARSHQPDGVVMDVQMGWGEAGLDALRRLEDEAGVAIPRIVAVTTREQDRQRLEQRGMHPAALLVEPYSREDLVAALEEALQVGGRDRDE